MLSIYLFCFVNAFSLGVLNVGQYNSKEKEQNKKHEKLHLYSLYKSEKTQTHTNEKYFNVNIVELQWVAVGVAHGAFRI